MFTFRSLSVVVLFRQYRLSCVGKATYVYVATAGDWVPKSILSFFLYFVPQNSRNDNFTNLPVKYSFPSAGIVKLYETGPA